MNCLYKTSTTNTFEEYKRFSRVLMYKKRSIIIYALLAVFLIFDSIVLDNPMFMIFAVVYTILIWLLHNMQVKKVFKTNKTLQNAEVNFEFYDDYFVETNAYGTTTLEYTKLHKIIETKTNFYFMLAKNQGFILVKKNFPEGLDKFLRNLKIDWSRGVNWSEKEFYKSIIAFRILCTLCIFGNEWGCNGWNLVVLSDYDNWI